MPTQLTPDTLTVATLSKMEERAENTAQDVTATEFVTEELLVEEISIDGMCGVY